MASSQLHSDNASHAEPPQLNKSLASWRSFFNIAMTFLTGLLTLLAMVPLFSVIIMLSYRGLKNFSFSWFTQLPPQPNAPGGGFGNAILGTTIVVAIAASLAVPFGVLVAIYLAEFGSMSRTASFVRFAAKVLTGLPSILAGVFAYALVVLTFQTFSAVAGGVALAMLMLPTVILTAEEAFKMVPRKMREAAFGMGATYTQVVWKVVVPTALPGVLTGVMLAVARAAGETAPLLFTALFSEHWFRFDSVRHAFEPTASLAVLIYNFSQVPYANQKEMAWGASLVLVAIVLFINITAQVLTRRKNT